MKMINFGESGMFLGVKLYFSIFTAINTVWIDLELGQHIEYMYISKTCFFRALCQALAGTGRRWPDLDLPPIAVQRLTAPDRRILKNRFC